VQSLQQSLSIDGDASIVTAGSKSDRVLAGDDVAALFGLEFDVSAPEPDAPAQKNVVPPVTRRTVRPTTPKSKPRAAQTANEPAGQVARPVAKTTSRPKSGFTAPGPLQCGSKFEAAGRKNARKVHPSSPSKRSFVAVSPLATVKSEPTPPDPATATSAHREQTRDKSRDRIARAAKWIGAKARHAAGNRVIISLR
jgi:hypothetical protein